MDQQSQDEIIQNLTKEILREIENSNKEYTDDEIKNMISKRLDEVISFEDDDASAEDGDEIDKIVNEEFTQNINDNETEANDLLSSLNSFSEIDKGQDDSVEEVVETIIQEEPKKKFFQEVSDLYKEELDRSIKCFKNSFESLKIMKETSIIEKIIIFAFLSIPAIFAGFVVLAFILLLLIFWQISIIFNVILKYLNKVEFSIKETITRIKRKIASLKSSSNLFNRLIFSNALYSLIMFNGLMYMLVRGMIIPVRSMAEINKVLANITARTADLASGILLAPSQLTLSNVNANALRSSGKDKTKERAKQQLKLKQLNQMKRLMKQAQLPKVQQNPQQKKREDLKPKMNKKNLLDDISKKVFAEQKNRDKNKAGEKEKIAIEKTTVEAKSPEVAKLSKENLEKSEIINNVFNIIKKDRRVQQANNLNIGLESLQTSDRQVNERIRIEEKIEKENKINDAADRLHEAGVPNIHKLTASYEERGSLREALMETDPNFESYSQKEKMSIAFDFATGRIAMEDLDDTRTQKHWIREHPNGTTEEFLDFKLKEAREDFQQEREEFKERWGTDCDMLMFQEMQKLGMDTKSRMTDEQAKQVIISIASRYPEDQQMDVVKDLREYNETYREVRACKQELAQEQERVARQQNPNFFKDYIQSRENDNGGRSR